MPVKDDQYSFRCSLCLKTLTCKHQGEKDVKRHVASFQHLKNAKGLKNTAPLTFGGNDTRLKVIHCMNGIMVTLIVAFDHR